MYCSNCGKEIDYGLNFCHYCGFQLPKNNVEESFKDEEGVVIQEINLKIKSKRIQNFDTIPIYKIVLMSVFTLGLYDYFLFAKYWKRYSEISGVNLSAFFRAWFAPITFFSLVPKLNKYLKENGIQTSQASSFFFPFFYFICQVLKQFLVGGLLGFLFIVPIQYKINKLNSDKFPAAEIDNLNFKDFMVFVLALIIIVGSLASAARNYY